MAGFVVGVSVWGPKALIIIAPMLTEGVGGKDGEVEGEACCRVWESKTDFDRESKTMVEDAMTMTGRVGAGEDKVLRVGCAGFAVSEGVGAGAPFDPWCAGLLWGMFGIVPFGCENTWGLTSKDTAGGVFLDG